MARGVRDLQRFTSRFSEIKVPFSTGRRNRGKVVNRVQTWAWLGNRFRDVKESKETFAEYQRMSVDDRNELKNDNGFFVGCPFAGKNRILHEVKPRRLITFDLDKCTPDLFDDLRAGFTNVSTYEFYWYTTRSHTDESPRVRLVFLADRLIGTEEYSPIARILASRLDPTMAAVDDVSFRPAQVMYLPTVSIDGVFRFGHNSGEMVPVDDILDDFRLTIGDPFDWTLLPFNEDQGQKRPPATRAERPNEKRGLIGAFCRAYDIESAIAEFIPDVYVPGDEHSSKPRYTYVAGTGANGAIVEDGGLFLYSHHSSDPCGERLVNAWDMIRLHRFGELDDGKDPDTPPSKLPSYKAMAEWAAALPAVQMEQLQDFEELTAELDDLPADDPDEIPAAERAAPAKPTAAKPAAAGDDLLDLLDDEGADADADIAELVGKPASRLIDEKAPRTADPDQGKETPIRRMNRKHAVTMVGGKAIIVWFRDRSRLEFMTRESANLVYANQRLATGPNGGSETIVEWWLRQPDRRTYPEGITFAPGRKTPGQLNLWQGFSVEPNPTGDCSLFLEHVRENLADGDETAAHYLFGWMADMIQNPNKKPGVALVLKGKKGVGKDVVAEHLGKLFETHYFKTSQMLHLTGNFNAHLEGKLLLHVEEGLWAGDKKAEGPLKSVITSRTMEIERKGVDVIQVPSVLRVYISSNEKWVVPATADERRFAVFNVGERRRQDRRFFRAMEEQMVNGGYGALLHFLQTYDLTGFDVGVPPNTAGLGGQKAASLKGPAAFVYEILEAGELPSPDGLFDETSTGWIDGRGARIDVAELYSAYEAWWQTRRSFGHGDLIGKIAFGREIQRLLGPARKEGRSTPDDSGRRRTTHVFSPLAECRAAFAEALNARLDWPESDDDILSLI